MTFDKTKSEQKKYSASSDNSNKDKYSDKKNPGKITSKSRIDLEVENEKNSNSRSVKQKGSSPKVAKKH